MVISMNWSRVRWFLIICLCLADLLLGFLLWRNYRGENIVSRAAIADAAALLSEADVRLDVDVVPTAVIREHVFRVPVSDAAYRNAFSGLVGSNVTGAYLLPASTGVSLLFENGDTVEYYHNLYLLYVRNGVDRESCSAMMDRFADDRSSFLATERSKAAQEADAAENFLAALTTGEISDARLRPRLVELYTAAEDPSMYLAVFREEIVYLNARRSAADVYDTEMRVLVQNGTVLYMTGTWVPCVPDETYRIKTLDQLNILFSERKRHMSLSHEGVIEGLGHAVQHTNAGCEIVSMQRLYYMLWDDAGTLYLRPSWLLDYRLEQEDHIPIQRDVLCDGITGSVVRQTEQVLDTSEHTAEAS